MRVLGFQIAALFVCAALRAQTELPPRIEVHDTRPNVEVAEEASALKIARDTKGLTELAAKYRANKERFVNDVWYLEIVYEIASQLPKDEAKAGWELEFLKKWADDEPANVTAQICYAQALVESAWRARGEDFRLRAVSADNAFGKNWDLYKERLREAGKVLDRAARLEHCPQRFAVRQSVALGLGWGRKRYLDALERAIERQPDFGTYYENAYRWMLPNWYGKTGDFEKWLAGKADSAPETERDMQYAKLVWNVKNLSLKDVLVFGPGRLDWERTKRGFDELIARDPKNFYIYVTFLQLALSADDRDTARAMFDIVGGRYDPNRWDNNADYFEAARRYAYSGGENPLRTAASKTDK